MATIRFESFGGIIPRTHPTLLPDGCAVVAHNCKLKNGKLVPIREPSLVDSNSYINYENNLETISDAKTLYIWNRNNNTKEFIAWGTDDIDIAEGNVYDDNYSRLFITGSTGIGENGTDPIVILKDNNSFVNDKVSLVKNILPHPVCILSSGSNKNTDNTRYTSYFQSWVDKYGYESPLSLAGKLYAVKYTKSENPNGTIEWKNSNGVILSGDDIPSDDDIDSLTFIKENSYRRVNGVVKEFIYGEESGYNNGDSVVVLAVNSNDIPKNAVSRRIYKAVTGSETDNIQFVSDIPLNTDSSLSVLDEDCGELNPNIESPDDSLRGISFVPGGFYVGFSVKNRKTVMFSDVMIPTSWPEAYRYSVRDNIVAISVSKNTVYVLTDGVPYSLTGTEPEGMVCSSLNSHAACVSKRSVCDAEGAVYFASNLGIMVIKVDAYRGTIITNLTEKFFSVEQWKKMNPESCIMIYHDSALYAFFNNGKDKFGLTINLNDGKAAISTNNEITQCMCEDKSTNEIYFVRGM